MILVPTQLSSTIIGNELSESDIKTIINNINKHLDNEQKALGENGKLEFLCTLNKDKSNVIPPEIKGRIDENRWGLSRIDYLLAHDAFRERFGRYFPHKTESKQPTPYSQSTFAFGIL